MEPFDISSGTYYCRFMKLRDFIGECFPSFRVIRNNKDIEIQGIKEFSDASHSAGSSHDAISIRYLTFENKYFVRLTIDKREDDTRSLALCLLADLLMQQPESKKVCEETITIEAMLDTIQSFNELLDAIIVIPKNER